jgi:hypothetical protein
VVRNIQFSSNFLASKGERCIPGQQEIVHYVISDQKAPTPLCMMGVKVVILSGQYWMLFSQVNGFHGLETWADAVSRYKVVPSNTKTIISGAAQFELVQYFVEFWNGNVMDRKGSVLSVDVFTPSHWTIEYFLKAL